MKRLFKEGDKIILGHHVYGWAEGYYGTVGTFVRYTIEGVQAIPNDSITGKYCSLTFDPNTCKPFKEETLRQLLEIIDNEKES